MGKIKYLSELLVIGYWLSVTPAAFAAIGPEPNPNLGTDYTPPALISNVKLASDGVKVIITWDDPPDADFHRVEVLRNDGAGTAITGVVRGRVQAGVKRYEDLDVLSGEAYKYQFRVMDLNFNTVTSPEYEVTVVAPAPAPVEPVVEVEPSPLPEEEGDPDASPLPAGQGQGEGIADPGELTTLLARFALSRDESAEAQYRTLVAQDMAEFGIQSTAAYETATVNFMVYGISDATRRLGAGERRALTRDYFATIGSGEVLWADMERLATGIKPAGRNLERERAQLPQVLGLWQKIVGHTPNFQDQAEDLAWNTLMYRVRFTRDLAKERQGIAEFQGFFSRLPQSPLDWAAVRALGYAL